MHSLRELSSHYKDTPYRIKHHHHHTVEMYYGSYSLINSYGNIFLLFFYIYIYNHILKYLQFRAFSTTLTDGISWWDYEMNYVHFNQSNIIYVIKRPLLPKCSAISFVSQIPTNNYWTYIGRNSQEGLNVHPWKVLGTEYKYFNIRSMYDKRVRLFYHLDFQRHPVCHLAS